MNTIHLNGYIQKRDRSDFTEEQSIELAERISSIIKTLGYELSVEPPVEEKEPKETDG